MRSLIILSLVAVFLTSCSGGKKKGVNPTTGLTDDEYNTLKTINDSFSQLDQAVEIGTKPPLPAASTPIEKADEMGKLIADGSCKLDGANKAPIDVSKNWDKTHTVTGANCPIKISHDWHFRGDSSKRHFFFSKSYEALTRDFKETARLQTYQIHEAELTVVNKTATQLVDGELSYRSFQVKDVGLVTAGITTKQSYNLKGKGGGSLTFQLNTRKKVKATVKITWYSGRDEVYLVNGTAVALNVIEDIFSSYELMEIKARSLNMLY